MVVLVLFLILAEYAPSRKAPATQITMVRLQSRLGTPSGSPIQPPGIPKPSPEPAKPSPPEAVTAPQSKATPMLTQPKEAKPAPKPKAPQAKPKASPPKARPIGAAKKPARPKPKPQVKTRKVEAPDQQKIESALSGIDSELQERERQAREPATTAGTSGEASTGTPGLGSPGGTQARAPGFALYQSKVRSKIIRNWVRTHSGGETKRLTARVALKINASGAVVSKSLIKRSGDSAFDHSALRAVEQASPLPAPPEGVRGEALREGFVVDFRARVSP